MIIIFKYLNNSLNMEVIDSIECNKYKDFLSWLEDNNITNYTILDIKIV